jgi:phosphatidylglycerophosphate synthase
MALAGWITLAVPFVMITRDIIVAYTRIANASEGAATSARFSGKFKAIIQGGGIPVVIALAMATVIDAIGGQAIETLRIIAACILILVTLWSMIDYIVGAWTAVRKMMSAE